MSTIKIKKISSGVGLDSNGILYICKDFTWVPKRPFIAPDGRKYTCIGGRNKYVHRLVAEYFIHNPGKLPRVEFINGNMGDPRAMNLRWTHNITRSRRDGKKLSLTSVKKIKSLLSRGDAASTVARAFGVHRSLISHIKAGRRWGNV